MNKLPSEQIRQSSFTAKDGTRICYQTVGNGPAIIVIPGVLSNASNYAVFSNTLARDFTVHTIERRGHGQSGPQGENYSITQDCENVLYLAKKTNARYLFGHSYGGLIVLEAARHNTHLKKIAVYEPGISLDGSISLSWADKYRKELAENKPLDAFVTFILATGPESNRKTPSWLLKILLPLFIKHDERQQIYSLLSANLLEHQEIARLDNTYKNYREITIPTLVMQGGKSGVAAFVLATKILTELLPTSQILQFPKLDHFGPDKSGPSEVAEAVKQFFSQD